MTDRKWFNSIFNASVNQELSSRNNHDVNNQDALPHHKNYEKNLIVWNPESELLITQGKRIVQCKDDEDGFCKLIDDISVKMKDRAFNNYGLSDYVPDDVDLKDLWNWVKINKSLEETLMIPTQKRLFGINQLFKKSSNEDYLKKILNSTICKSDSNYVEWFGLDPNISVKVKIYKSEQRRRGLLLCGWCDNLDDHQAIYKMIDNLESKGEFERAAAISIFNLNLKRAIDCLTKCASTPNEKGGNETYATLAMALSGYTGNFNNSLWHDIGKSIKNRFDDVYLKSIIYFLTSDSYYDEILYENNLKLSDRLAFALIFLPDHELDEYMVKQTKLFIDQGNILGLLLVGLTEDGLKLMKNYVERTSDIQTVSLLILNALPNPIYKNKQVSIWIQNYKEFLDRLRLWTITAKFNISWFKNIPEDGEVHYQIYMNCNFCGSNVSPLLHNVNAAKLLQNNSSGQHYGRVSISAASNLKRIQSCPNCTKPLPRCSLCACHLGSPTPFHSNQNHDDDSKIEDSHKKLNQFSNWFSWCQTCKHGGHSRHLLEWFAKNNECPVSGCSCKCINDSISKVVARY